MSCSSLLASKVVFFACLALLANSCCGVTSPREVNELFREVLQQRHLGYKLKDGDTLSVRFYNRPGDLNQTEVIVLPDGRSDLFFMDSAQLAGKTVPEVEAELKARVATEVRDAEVSIQVQPRDEQVHMVGQFERPGVVPLTTKMTLHEAISAVGGMRITGDTDWALLRRPYVNQRQPDRFRIDLNDESEEIFLLPGDQIVLERNFVAEVVNYLREYIFGVLPGNTLYGAAFAAL